MKLSRILAIAQRIAKQFRHDKRTLGLLFVVPIVVISLLGPLLTTSAEFKIGLVDEDSAYAPSAPPSVPSGQRPMGADSALPGKAIAVKPKPVKVSDSIIKSLEGTKEVTLIKLKNDGVGPALREGRAIAVIAFPKDFSKSALTGGSVNPLVSVDSSNPSRARGALELIQKSLTAKSVDGIDRKEPLEVKYVYGGEDFDALDYFAPAFIAFFAFFFVFLLTSVSFLRERGQGTIERLMASPVRRIEVILGYQLGFIFFATIQVAIIMLYTIYALNVRYVGNIGAIFFIEFLLTLVSVNMGIFFSSFAVNELQVIQFIPIVITPQGLLSGVVIPVEDMPKYFQWLANVMPLTHANNALKAIMIKGYPLGDVSFEIGFLLGFALLMVVLSALMIRRQVA